MNRILGWFGYEIAYVCEWDSYSERYSTIDAMMHRPIHRDMAVAPPWAKMCLVSIKKGKCNGR